jgi:hypothetical protein
MNSTGTRVISISLRQGYSGGDNPDPALVSEDLDECRNYLKDDEKKYLLQRMPENHRRDQSSQALGPTTTNRG